jgi:hypothetical protein
LKWLGIKIESAEVGSDLPATHEAGSLGIAQWHPVPDLPAREGSGGFLPPIVDKTARNSLSQKLDAARSCVVALPFGSWRVLDNLSSELQNPNLSTTAPSYWLSDTLRR